MFKLTIVDYDLSRFLLAQKQTYPQALSEIKEGRKQTHWMWFVFPQIKGLGFSETSKYYAIQDLDEAKAYLDHEVLGSRLLEISQALLQLEENNPNEIFGSPDDMKLKSSMTLFALASEKRASVFLKVLEKFFIGDIDEKTLILLIKQE
jgi:uncharacterized protein (DUF1810 family)